MAEKQEPEVIVKDLSGDPDEIMEIESLCMNCHENGMTRMLPTKIPYFRSVVVSSFSCDHCNYRNTELLQLGDLQPKGIKISVIIKTKQDLNRQLVIAPSAYVRIPDVDLDIPPSKGNLTTAEGILQNTMDDLEFQQPVRRITDPENAAKIDEFIARLQRLKDLAAPFTIIVDDPSGNSFIENPNAPRKDDQMTITHYQRSKDQAEALGFQVEEEGAADENVENVEKPEEVITFQVQCPNCQASCETRMKQVEIPHFKEVIIMATACEKCGVRENEVKSGSGVEPKGRRIVLKITDPSDLSRDVLKSDMAAVRIPELDFETEEGTLGGKFTTLEGLLTDIKNQLQGDTPFVTGDAAVEGRRNKLGDFVNELDEVISGRRLNVHIELDDPSGNSYLQNVYAPDPDPEMVITEYERNYEQNELLGLNDIKTEGYEKD